MTFELAIICAVAGVVLGLRYNVVVLIPAVMFALLFGVVVGISRSEGVLLTTFLAAGLAVAVQAGYLAGIAIYAVLESIDARRRDRNHREGRSWGESWPHPWRAFLWELTPSSVVRFRRSPPPQA